MAKKKMTCRKDNATTKSTDRQNPQDASAKLSNLKSLNAMLLKETVERRQEVKCLLESKKAMEIELSRLFSDIESVKTQFTRFIHENMGFYLEKDMLSAFMESQVRDIVEELDALKVEMSEIEAEKGTVMEMNKDLLQEKAEIEKKLEDTEREMMEVVRERNKMDMAKREGDWEIGSLKRAINKLEGEIKKENEIVDQLARERDELKRDLDAQIEETVRLNDKLTEMKIRGMKRKGEIEEAAAVIEQLKKQIEEMDSEKTLFNKEKCQQLTRIRELEKEVGAVKAAGNTKKNFWTWVVSSVAVAISRIVSFVYANNSPKRR